MHLILAAIWFLAAVYFFLSDWGRMGERGFHVPLSVLALLFALYNLMRWWSYRLARSRREQGQQALPRRRIRRSSKDQPEADAGGWLDGESAPGKE